MRNRFLIQKSVSLIKVFVKRYGVWGKENKLFSKSFCLFPKIQIMKKILLTEGTGFFGKSILDMLKRGKLAGYFPLTAMRFEL